MSKRTFPKTALVLLTLICLQAALAFSASAATAPPSIPQLKVYVGPSSVPADNGAYNSVVVVLQDSAGKPVRASEDTSVRLSSSLTEIGTVDSTITIVKGETFAEATFYSTYTPGTTTITAAASGYPTVQAAITTVGPIPSTIAVYGFPPVLPSDGGTYPAVVVQLQDSAGTPAKAPIGDVQVMLSSSDSSAATVDASVTIKGGSTCAVANLKTTNTAGSAAITAIASGYTSKQTTITTYAPGNESSQLKVYVATPKVSADGVVYQQVAVQLQNSTGKIAKAQTAINVVLSSSSVQVGTVDITITIPAGKSYAIATFSSTFLSGTTTIAAAATDCKSDQEPITTVGPVPSKLAVYCLPPSLPSDEKPYGSVLVQLQDSSGKPAKDPSGNITVFLFSSAPTAGNVSSALTIPFGETYSVGTFYSTFAANQTTITAQGSGYVPGQAKMTTYLIDQCKLNLTLTATPTTIAPKEQATIRGYVTYNGSGPASGVSVAFKSDKTTSCTSVKEEGNGYYSFIFTGGNVTKDTVYTFTVNATKAGYNATQTKISVTVSPSGNNTGTILLQINDGDGNAVSGATVTGSNGLNGVTNSTGYISFNGVLAGSYSIQVSKDGYDLKEETLQFTAGQASSKTVTLSRTSSSFFSLPIIIGIVVAIVVSTVTVVMVIRKRRNGSYDEEDAEP